MPHIVVRHSLAARGLRSNPHWVGWQRGEPSVRRLLLLQDHRKADFEGGAVSFKRLETNRATEHPA